MVLLEAMIYPNAKRMGLHWLLWVATAVWIMKLHAAEMDRLP